MIELLLSCNAPDSFGGIFMGMPDGVRIWYAQLIEAGSSKDFTIFVNAVIITTDNNQAGRF